MVGIRIVNELTQNLYLAIPSEPTFLGTTTVAVSYTHLDVYKRQVTTIHLTWLEFMQLI